MSDGRHYQEILKSHLEKKQLRSPKVSPCVLEDGLYAVTVTVQDYSISELGSGTTKNAAVEDATQKVIREIELLSLNEVQVIGANDTVTRSQPKGYVALLHEFAQKHKLGKPYYQVVSTPMGSENDFKIEVSIGTYRQDGVGSTKKVAKMMASAKIYRDLMKDVCDEEVDLAGFQSGSDSRNTTVERLEEEEEDQDDFLFSDLSEFQGSIKNRLVSQYHFSAPVHSSQLEDIQDLPESLEDLEMSRSQVIIDEPDPCPISFDVSSDWYFSNILVTKASRLPNIRVSFSKMKEIENTQQRTFLCFLTIDYVSDKPISGQCGNNKFYKNVTRDLTLKSASEKLSEIALRTAELLGDEIDCLVTEVDQSVECMSLSFDGGLSSN